MLGCAIIRCDTGAMVDKDDSVIIQIRSRVYTNTLILVCLSSPSSSMPLSMSVSVDLCSAESQAPHAQCNTLVERKKEKFSGHDENCRQNAWDLEDSMVTSSRPPGRPQTRPDDRTWNGGVAAQAADGSQQTAGAANEQCYRYIHH